VIANSLMEVKPKGRWTVNRATRSTPAIGKLSGNDECAQKHSQAAE